MLQNLIIYGGSFDPLHYGHLNTALAVQSAFNFECFLFLPCKAPVLKEPTVASTDQRVTMLRLALTPYPNFNIDLREVERSTPSYMVRTLEDFRAEFGSMIPITLLIGLDSYVQLIKWNHWENILELCHLLVIGRPPNNKHKIPTILSKLLNTHETFDKSELLNTPRGKIFQYDAGAYDISSTWIREQIRQGNDVESYLPEAIYQYIREQNIYCSNKT